MLSALIRSLSLKLGMDIGDYSKKAEMVAEENKKMAKSATDALGPLNQLGMAFRGRGEFIGLAALATLTVRVSDNFEKLSRQAQQFAGILDSFGDRAGLAIFQSLPFIGGAFQIGKEAEEADRYNQAISRAANAIRERTAAIKEAGMEGEALAIQRIADGHRKNADAIRAEATAIEAAERARYSPGDPKLTTWEWWNLGSQEKRELAMQQNPFPGSSQAAALLALAAREAGLARSAKREWIDQHFVHKPGDMLPAFKDATSDLFNIDEDSDRDYARAYDRRVREANRVAKHAEHVRDEFMRREDERVQREALRVHEETRTPVEKAAEEVQKLLADLGPTTDVARRLVTLRAGLSGPQFAGLATYGSQSQARLAGEQRNTFEQEVQKALDLLTHNSDKMTDNLSYVIKILGGGADI